jgi:nucleotide-binding universal stress UspA family protein
MNDARARARDTRGLAWEQLHHKDAATNREGQMATMMQFGTATHPVVPQRTAAPILVATDGTVQSEPAVATARLLAKRDANPVRLVTVIEPAACGAAGFEVQLLNSVLSDEWIAARRLKALEQLAEVSPGARWVVDVEVGDPAECIARKAEELGAGLVIVGRGKHRFIDRVLGGETALRLTRRSRVPVLAVSEGKQGLPRTIVVAMDFSSASRAAARLAARIAGEGSRIFLAHVLPVEEPQKGRSWMMLHEARVIERLARVARQLREESDAIIETRVLRGRPGKRLLDFVGEIGADLIAIGPRGHDMLARFLGGEVSGPLFRNASCSLLAVPRRALDAEREAVLAAAVARRDARTLADEWVGALDDFDARNVGRRAMLEIDTLDFGAQTELMGYAFHGAVYDSHDQRLSLMFGDGGGGDAHLTHSISNVRAVNVLPDPADDRRDLALRIGHDGGQTLVVFDGDGG